MPSYNSIVTNIKDTDAVKSNIVNVPINQLAERTDYLKAVLDNITASEFNYLNHVPVSAVTEVGNAVYWDTANRRFGKTLARWDDDLSPYGSLLPAESSYMTGILVSKSNGNTGSVIISGYISDFQDVETLFGSASPEAGIYYVSGDTEGLLTKVPPPMTIPAVMYDGVGNVLFMPTSSIVSNHDHNKYLLKVPDWLPASSFSDMDVPPGAVWGYDVANASDSLHSLFTLYTGSGAFVLYGSGTILNEDYILFTNENIWILDTDPPMEDIIAHIAYPNAHGPNIIRAVTSDTENYFSFNVDNGLLTINMLDQIWDPALDNSIYALKDIVNNTKKKGFIVSQLLPGEGVTVSSEDNEGHGMCTVSVDSEMNKLIDADIVNLNNAIQRTDGGLIYSVFPAHRTSSMVATVNLSSWSGADRGIKLRLWVRGLASGGATPAFSVKMYIFPPADEAGVGLPNVITTQISGGSIGTSIDRYYLCEVELNDSITVAPESQIQYDIRPTVSTPSEDYLILRQGVTTRIITP